MSKLSRRKFIGTTAVAAGAIAVLDGSAIAQQSKAGLFPIPDLAGDALSRLGWDQFLPFVNTDFSFYKVGRGGDAIPLRLIDMKDARPLRSKARKLRQENFVLKFVSIERLPLGGATYSVNHFNLGDFDLFVSEGAEVAGGFTYTAVINRVTVATRS